jgi:hypothetical protein
LYAWSHATLQRRLPYLGCHKLSDLTKYEEKNVWGRLLNIYETFANLKQKVHNLYKSNCMLYKKCTNIWESWRISNEIRVEVLLYQREECGMQATISYFRYTSVLCFQLLFLFGLNTKVLANCGLPPKLLPLI